MIFSTSIFLLTDVMLRSLYNGIFSPNFFTMYNDRDLSVMSCMNFYTCTNCNVSHLLDFFIPHLFMSWFGRCRVGIRIINMATRNCHVSYLMDVFIFHLFVMSWFDYHVSYLLNYLSHLFVVSWFCRCRVSCVMSPNFFKIFIFFNDFFL